MQRGGIAGIDETLLGHPDPQATFSKVPNGAAALALWHEPQFAEQAAAQGAFLQLSGHTHGGQIHVAGITEAFFRRFGQPYLRGHYQVNGNQLYVNRGLGFGRGGKHPRIDSEPELALFVLKRAPEDGVKYSSALRES